MELVCKDKAANFPVRDEARHERQEEQKASYGAQAPDCNSGVCRKPLSLSEFNNGKTGTIALMSEPQLAAEGGVA